jgi:hypothetical protein
MNSVNRHLNADSKAATLLAMRSARKEVLLVVEGDTDVDLFSNALGIPRSNILSCDGKEALMLVYGMAPQKGIDLGSIFIRDRDNDNIGTGLNHGVLLLVTELYDIEMELLEKRLSGRILSEFLRRPLESHEVAAEFKKLCEAAACIGAIRIHSQRNGIDLDFNELKHSKFIKMKDMSVNLAEALRYIFAKSEKTIDDREAQVRAVSAIIGERRAVEMVCGKDFIDILHLSLSRHYDACPSGECLPAVLSRIVRISTVHDDLKSMAIYPPLKAHVESCGYRWPGATL